MKLTDEILKSWVIGPEGQFFDRKSARIAPKDLAAHLSAFANASGGMIVLGIENNGEISGVNDDQENSLRQAGMNFLELLPEFSADLVETDTGKQTH